MIKIPRNLTYSLLVLVVILMMPMLATAGFDQKRVDSFINLMVSEHGYDEKLLRDLLLKTRLQNKIIEAITRPAEGKPWHVYRKIFLTEKRIKGGVEFWNQNAELLEKAEKDYGVDAAVITAIIGVETFYGRHAGTYRVMDSLATLGFNYPKRADFFASELKHFLLLCQEQGFEPFSLKGSYAGAMGMPQFISSSYRAYAVDFDEDGTTDIWANRADVIGSVASYFKRHGWLRGQGITIPLANVKDSKTTQALVEKGLKPSLSLEQLKLAQISLPEDVLQTNDKVTLLAFEQTAGTDFWLGLPNFYVITRYNHSPLYAMAVYQLSQEIVKARAKSLDTKK